MLLTLIVSLVVIGGAWVALWWSRRRGTFEVAVVPLIPFALLPVAAAVVFGTRDIVNGFTRIAEQGFGGPVAVLEFSADAMRALEVGIALGLMTVITAMSVERLVRDEETPAAERRGQWMAWALILLVIPVGALLAYTLRVVGFVTMVGDPSLSGDAGMAAAMGALNVATLGELSAAFSRRLVLLFLGGAVLCAGIVAVGVLAVTTTVLCRPSGGGYTQVVGSGLVLGGVAAMAAVAIRHIEILEWIAAHRAP